MASLKKMEGQMKKIIIMTFVNLFLTIAVFSQTTYTIDNTGNGDFNSFTEAINFLNGIGNEIPSEGVIFNVISGQSFYENPPTIFQVLGNETSEVIFQKLGNEENPIIYDETAVGGIAVIDIKESSFITFDGIDITDPDPENSSYFGDGYQIYTGNSYEYPTHDITIKNCKISNFDYAGIHIRRAAYSVLIEKNETFHTADYVVSNSGSSTSGIRLIGNSNYADDIGIVKNKVYGLKRGVYNNQIYGIYLYGANATAANNFVSIQTDNNTIEGIRADTKNDETINIYYNSVYLNGESGNTLSSAMHIYGDDETVTLYVKDNIFINDRIQNDYTYGIYVQSTVPIINLDHNTYFVNNAENDFFGYWGIFGNYDSFLDWQTITDLDTNSNIKNVEFSDIDDHDLHLTGSSIGDSDLYGIPIPCFSEDIDGDFRSATEPYKGADECFPQTAPPQNISIYHDGTNLIINWDFEPGILYKLYESSDASSFFPNEWILIWTGFNNEYILSPCVETVKFFCVTANN